ncbi:MAG: hypothetical protein WCP06_12245 [Verrucomicrobiota bacterium]
MKLKAILILCGATLAAAGLVIGFGSAARAVGIDYDRHRPTLQSPDSDELQTRQPHPSNDRFSPDAFREDLLK